MSKLEVNDDDKVSPVHILESIHHLIDPVFEDLEDLKESRYPEKNHFVLSDSKEKKRAASKILFHFRMFKIFKQFLKNGYSTYLKLLGNEKIDELARLTFGRTISQFTTQKNEFITSDNPYLHQNPRYNRSDLDFSGPLMDSLLEYFGKKSDRNFRYLPYLRMENFPFDQILKSVYGPDIKEMELLNREYHDKFLMLKINFNSGLRDQLVALGAIPSPLDLSVNCLELCKEEKKEFSKVSDLIQIPNAPNDFLTLQRTINQLSRIVNSSLPTRHLAKFLQNLLNGLKNYSFNFDEKIIQRMYLFLFLAIHFSKNSYERFGLWVYGIVNELSLLLYANKEKIEKEIFYQKFVEATLKNFSNFGLEEKKSTDSDSYEFLVIPAASGCNAFAIAMRLIETLTPETGKLRMFVKNPVYFENSKIMDFWENKIDFIYDNPGVEQDENPYGSTDIIYFSTGPICNPSGNYLGSDINTIIKKVIDKNHPLKKHVVLLIDATTSLYSKLKISSEFIKYFTSGELTLLVFESLVKFGGGHSEQAHGGRITAICSKKFFKKEVLENFIIAGQKDLVQHLDMRVCAYFQIHGGKNLETLKEIAFRNGALYNKIVLSSPASPEMKIISVISDEKTTNLNDYYFLAYALSNSVKTIKIINYLVPERDSFGHFVTSGTVMLFDNYIRISANASDVLDSLINSTAIYLYSTYTDLQLIRCLAYFYITHTQTIHINLKDSVILLSMALVLSDDKSPDAPTKNYPDLPSLIKAILYLIDSSLIGRYPYTKVYRYSLKGESGQALKFSEQFFKPKNKPSPALIKPDNRAEGSFITS